MAQPQTSFGGSIGLGEESTYGTAVALTNWLEVRSISLEREIDYQPEGTLGRTGDVGRMSRRKYVASDNVSGGFEFNASYDDSTLMFLKHAMGVVSTSGASSPYTHLFTLGDLPTGLTIEKVANSSKAEKFEGCNIVDFTLSVAAGELMTISATVIGETSGGIISTTSATYTSNGEEVKYHQAGQLSFNSANYDVTSLSAVFSSGVDRRQTLGSKFTKCPTPAAKREVVITCEIEWLADTLHAAFLAGTESDVAITFTGSGVNTLVLTGHNAYIRSVTTPVQGPGVITQSVEFVCQYSDVNNLGASISITNANALATAN